MLKLVSHFGGSTSRFIHEGDFIYLSFGPEFAILDVSDPHKPNRIGYTVFEETIMDVFVVGPIAYITLGHAGLKIVDISNPARPFEIGSCNVFSPSKPALSVQVNQGYAFVAAQDAGLRVIEVADPTNAREVAAFELPPPEENRYFRCIEALNRGNFIYLIAGGDIFVLDVTDPLIPMLTNQISRAMFGSDVKGGFVQLRLSEHYLCAIYERYGSDEFRNSFVVFDLLDPAQPRLLRQEELKVDEVNIYSIAVNSIYLVASNYDPPETIVYIKDLAKLEQPFAKGPTSLDSRLTIKGKLAYLVRNGLTIVDLSDPQQPQEIGHYPVPWIFKALVLRGQYAYLSCGYSGLYVMDMSNPVTPSVVGWLENPKSFAADLVLGNNSLIYQAETWADEYDIENSETGVGIIELDELLKPRYLAYLPAIEGFVDGVAISDDYLFVVETRYPEPFKSVIRIFKGANNRELEAQGFYKLSDQVGKLVVENSGNYLFFYQKGKIAVLDVSDKYHPTEVETLMLEKPLNETELGWSKNKPCKLMIIEESRRAILFEVSPVVQPRKLVEYDISGLVDTRIQSKSFEFEVNPEGFQVLKLDPPGSEEPIVVSTHKIKLGSYKIIQHENYVYVLTELNGMYVMRDEKSVVV